VSDQIHQISLCSLHNVWVFSMRENRAPRTTEVRAAALIWHMPIWPCLRGRSPADLGDLLAWCLVGSNHPHSPAAVALAAANCRSRNCRLFHSIAALRAPGLSAARDLR
jgi:hypothetical protein